MSRTLLGCLFMLVSLTVNAADIIMKVNSRQTAFIVKLAANPTTGFKWSVLQYDKNLLTLTQSMYQKNPSKRIGSGGEVAFKFVLNKGKTYPKKTKMMFNYQRPWEKDHGKNQTVIINFF